MDIKGSLERLIVFTLLDYERLIHEETIYGG